MAFTLRRILPVRESFCNGHRLDTTRKPIASPNLTQWQDPDPFPPFRDPVEMTKGASGPTVDPTVWILGWTLSIQFQELRACSQQI